MVIILPLELYATYKSYPQRNFAKVYGLSAKLGINFLDKLQLGSLKVHKITGANDIASIRGDTRFEEYQKANACGKEIQTYQKMMKHYYVLV